VQERLNLVQCPRFDSVAKILCEINDDFTKSQIASKNYECNEWSIETTESIEILSAKASAANQKESRNLLEAWISPSIQHKRKVSSGEDFKFVYCTLK
jgi:hypothetical protein